MLSPLRNRFGIPGVISVIALVFAMLGGAYAANKDGGSGSATASAKKGPPGPRGKQGKPGKPGATGPAGPQGPAGANGKDGANGSNGSNGAPGAAGKSVVSTQFSGVQGPCEFGGTSFEVEGSGSKKYACTGKEGEEGPKGDKGEPWTLGGTLPSGATETGIWGINGGVVGTISFPISFPIPLKTAPEVILLNEEELSKPGCPGYDAKGNPQADPGKLCVYTDARGEVTTGATVFYHSVPATPETFGEIVPGASTTGAIFKGNCDATFCFIAGTWAVTAAP